VQYVLGVRWGAIMGTFISDKRPPTPKEGLELPISFDVGKGNLRLSATACEATDFARQKPRKTLSFGAFFLYPRTHP
jgi:hypothetical protein